MCTNSESRITVANINNDFSKVTKLAGENGSVVILENDSPKYVVIDISKYSENKINIEKVADRILEENMEAFLELAK